MRLAAAERTPSKPDRFALVQRLRRDSPGSAVDRLCGALEVNRPGYCKWRSSARARIEREEHDPEPRDAVMEALEARGHRKGSRQIRNRMRNRRNVGVNRKCVRRIMRRYGIRRPVRKEGPYASMRADGDPEHMPDLLDRQFFPGEAGRVFIADITYVPARDAPWLHPSATEDSETGGVAAWKASKSLAMPFVMDRLRQLGEHGFRAGP